MAAKEYGERVDRMCWELEVIGLPDPSYNNDTFILKTTVKSFLIKKLPIDDRKRVDWVRIDAKNVDWRPKREDQRSKREDW